MKSLIVCCLVVIAAGQAPAQMGWMGQHPPVNDPSTYVAQDVYVSLEPLDSASQAFGLTPADVNDVLRLSVESTGWVLREGADNIISVKLTPLAQRQEDLLTFQIDAAAGAQARPMQEGTGGLSATSVIDVPVNGKAKLLGAINQLVSKVSRRFRQEIMKRSIELNRSMDPKQRRHLDSYQDIHD